MATTTGPGHPRRDGDVLIYVCLRLHCAAEIYLDKDSERP